MQRSSFSNISILRELIFETLQFLRKSTRICLCKISIFLNSAKINPQKILKVLKITQKIGHFPDCTFPRPTLPRLTHPRLDISPTRHFPERLFPRLDVSPTGHFPDQTFPRVDIYLTTHFRFQTLLN